MSNQVNSMNKGLTVKDLVTTGIFTALLFVFVLVGGVIYAMKFPVFHNRFQYFGCHELFHVFVMAGSLCHFIVMYVYLCS